MKSNKILKVGVGLSVTAVPVLATTTFEVSLTSSGSILYNLVGGSPHFHTTFPLNASSEGVHPPDSPTHDDAQCIFHTYCQHTTRRAMHIQHSKGKFSLRAAPWVSRKGLEASQLSHGARSFPQGRISQGRLQNTKDVAISPPGQH